VKRNKRYAACSICLRVRRGSEWVRAAHVIRQTRSYELDAPPRLRRAVCDHCAEAILGRRASGRCQEPRSTRSRLVSPVRAVLFVATAVVIGVLGSGADSDSSAAVGRVPVFFLKGEQLVSVTRPGTSRAEAVRQLVRGPTVKETASGVRSYIPPRTAVRSVVVAPELATVDVSRAFIVGGRVDSRLARLAQLVRTVSGSKRTLPVQLLVEGRKVSGVFPGVPTGSPVTFRYLQSPSVPVPVAPKAKRSPVDPALRVVQQRLIGLGYLRAGSADGRSGPMTQEAITAFQKWEGVPRTGVLDAKTKARLAKALRPGPVGHSSVRRRLEVLLDRQVALLIDGDRVLFTIAVSSGKPSTPTPPGHYRVYAKIARWWSTPFREWLPLAVPFVGGIAFHEYLDVPTFAASHGCVRQLPAVARLTYDFATVGMPVDVIARTQPAHRDD
jgi:peptidoglycan hydrolase-like protein with peptidoglycan-binding domain